MTISIVTLILIYWNNCDFKIKPVPRVVTLTSEPLQKKQSLCEYVIIYYGTQRILLGLFPLVDVKSNEWWRNSNEVEHQKVRVGPDLRTKTPHSYIHGQK